MTTGMYQEPAPSLSNDVTSLPELSQRTRRSVTHRAAPTLGSDMSKAEQQESLRLQLVDQYRNHFHITVSIFKGITLGAAAYALLAILAANGTLDARVQLTAISFWTASFIAMIVTYDGMMLQSLVTIAAPNVIDIMIPFFLGVSEFMLFPILSPVLSNGNPSQSTPAALRHLAWWPLGMAFVLLITNLFQLNAQTALTTTRDELPPLLESFIVRFKSLQRKNLVGGFGFMLFNLLAFVVLRHGFPHVGPLASLPSPAELRQWEGILGPLFIGQLCFGLWSINQIRRELADTLARAAQ